MTRLGPCHMVLPGFLLASCQYDVGIQSAISAKAANSLLRAVENRDASDLEGA